MNKYIVEYKLWDGKVPYFIEDGGYFPLNEKLIGITKDYDSCYIPKMKTWECDLLDFDRATLKARLDTMSLKDIEGNLLDTAILSENFFTERGL